MADSDHVIGRTLERRELAKFASAAATGPAALSLEGDAGGGQDDAVVVGARACA